VLRCRSTPAGDARVGATTVKIIVAFTILLDVHLKIQTGGCKMGKLSNIIPVSDLRQDAAKLLKQLQTNDEPLIITQRGRASAVILGVDAYEKLEHEKEILRLLAKGEKEIEAGIGYDLDSVLVEADDFLNKDPL
jgi:prevent-host-death family protein